MALGKAPSAHVCFRCQLRLLRQVLRPIPISATYTPTRWRFRQKHTKASADNLEESKLTSSLPRMPNQVIKIESKLQELSRRQRSRRGTVYKRLPLKNDRLTEHPLGRLHGFRGRKVREQAVGLRIDTLGTESKVIVLRDAGFHFSPRLEIEECTEGEKVDILAQLDAERGLIRQDEVEKNIEELKPKDFLKSITWDELQLLEQQLVNGFTVSQLAGYIGHFEKRWRSKDLSNLGGLHNENPSLIIRETKWMPGISETGGAFDESMLRGYGADAFTPKQQLVLQLLRQCWQLEVREVIESIGEIELEMRSAELELLIKGRNPVLRSISDRLIASQEERIEAFRSRCVIRITAPKEKAIVIVQEIQNVLRNIKRINVDLNALGQKQDGVKMNVAKNMNEIYEKSVLDHLSRLTETQISLLPGNQLIISCINRKPDTNLSTGADVARRLLLTSSDFFNHNASQLASNDISEPLLAVQYHATGDMSWHDQLRNWVRLVSAVPLSASAMREADNSQHLSTEPSRANDNTNKETRVRLNAISSLNSFNQLDREMEEKKENMQNQLHKTHYYGFWEHRTLTTTSAVVGHILHEVSSSSEVTSVSSRIPDTRHTKFHPETIHLSRLLGDLEPPSSPPRVSLVMRFLPSPWTDGGSKHPNRFPPLEMRFTVDPETKALGLEEIMAVMVSTSSNVMLPSLPLDLQFRQRSTARLCTINSQQLPQVTAFLEACQLNITRGRLETPPGLNLPIARHLCNPAPSDRTSSIVEDCVDCEYIFAGLEYRNAISLNFANWSLVYTSIEGGRADGRKGELSLQPHRPNGKTFGIPETSAELRENETKDFTHASYSLVETLGSYERIQIRKEEAATN